MFLPVGSLAGDYLKEEVGVELDWIRKIAGSYEAQTPGGAKMKVEINDITTHDLLIMKKEIEPLFPGVVGSVVKIPCPPERAKQVKPYLSALFLCRPIFAGVKKEHRDPTFDKPWENRFTINYIRSEFVGLCIFDRNSGEILFKKLKKQN